MVRDRLRQRPDPQREVNADVSAADHHTPWQYCRAVLSPPARQSFQPGTPHSQVSRPRSTTAAPCDAARVTACAPAPSRRSTARCSPAASPSTAATAPRLSRHSARPAASTRTRQRAHLDQTPADWASTRPGPRRHRAHRDRPVPQRTAPPCRRSSTFSDDHPARPHGSRRAFKDTVFSHDSGSWVIARSRQTIPNSSSPSHWTLIVFRNTT